MISHYDMDGVTFKILKFYVVKSSTFRKISLIQKMAIGPKCRDFEYLKNRLKIEPARAELVFFTT